MVTYIKRNVPGYYIRLDRELNPEQYSNIGTSYEDFQKGLYVKLSDEQVEFHEQNPNATVKEVWEMKIKEYVEPERTLEQAKAEKIAEIDAYDKSPAVDSFTINGQIVAWFSPEQRSDYNLSIQSAETKGIETLNFVVGSHVLQIPTLMAKVMLAEVQLYANSAYMVTAQHKLAVEALEDIEAVDAYNYEEGYPEKLNFEIS